MEIKEVRLKSSQELSSIVVNFRKEFVNLVFQKKLGHHNNFARFGVIRKSIARILTVLNERKREEKNA